MFLLETSSYAREITSRTRGRRERKLCVIPQKNVTRVKRVKLCLPSYYVTRRDVRTNACTHAEKKQRSQAVFFPRAAGSECELARNFLSKWKYEFFSLSRVFLVSSGALCTRSADERIPASACLSSDEWRLYLKKIFDYVRVRACVCVRRLG